MTYKINDYSYQQAKKLGVTIKPSTNKNKKIDVFKDNKKIASIGAINYMDYPSYIKSDGLQYANERKKLYKIRHQKDLNSGNGWWALNLLW